MKVVSSRLALPVSILAMIFAAVIPADGAPTSANRTFRAKVQYCDDCHGLSGRGYRGYYPMPRLAGQQTEYFENQLTAFIEHRRVNRIMSRVASSLSPEMRTALATHFSDLNPKPFGGAPRQLVAAGKAIYEEGAPDANVPACSVCHGPDGEGAGGIPRLAGQLYPYLLKELTNWSKERGQNPSAPDTSAIMQPIAHVLTKSQIEALAAYLSYLD
jgi:cytochrome c553